jgi:hypothetical protein
LDRLSLSFPVWDLADRDAWSDHSVQVRSGLQALSAHVEVDGAPFFIGARQVDRGGDVQWFGKVEGNPARVGDPDGVGLCPAEQLGERLAPVLELVRRHYLEPLPAAEDYRVKRLDVARDFDGVGDVPALLLGLAGVHRPWSRKNNLYNDATRQGAQTLLVGSKAGSVRLYDKHSETCGRAPEGRLRWEAEARGAWCARYGSVERLGDVNRTRVEQLARDRWRWSGMGVEVMTREAGVDRVLRSDLSPATQRSFLGWLLLSSCGVEPTRNKHTAAKYRKLARDLGVSLEPEEVRLRRACRLDWEEGTVIERAA